MVKLVNRAKMTTATSGTGTITLGTAVSAFQTFADAGVSDSDVVRYVIEDGNDWEVGTGTYTASGTTLSRTVIESSNSDAAIDLSGSAVVYVTAAAGDLQELVTFAETFTLPTTDGTADQVLKTDGSGVLSFADGGGGGAFVPIGKTTASASAAVDIALTGGYSAYVVRLDGVSFGTDNVLLYLRFSTDAGSSFLLSGYEYNYYWLVPSDTNSRAAGQSVSVLGGQIGNASGEILNGMLYIYPADGARTTLANGHLNYVQKDALLASTWTTTWQSGTTAVDAVRFYPSSGTISGDFHLYGIADGA